MIGSSTAAVGVALAICMLSTVAMADEKKVCSTTAESAQSHRTEGKLVTAREELVRCAQESCPKVVREACAGWLDEIATELPSIVLRAVDAQGNDVAEVRVEAAGAVLASHLDGKAIPLDPGSLKLHFVAPGFVDKDLDLVVARGERSRVVRVILDRKDGVAGPPTPPVGATRHGLSPVPGWVLLGTGLATLAAFGVLEGIGQSQYADLEDGCGKDTSCTDKETASTRSTFTAAAVTFGLGLAIAGTGGTLLIVSAATRPKTAGTGASVSVGVSPVGLKVFGHF